MWREEPYRWLSVYGKVFKISALWCALDYCASVSGIFDDGNKIYDSLICGEMLTRWATVIFWNEILNDGDISFINNNYDAGVFVRKLRSPLVITFGVILWNVLSHDSLTFIGSGVEFDLYTYYAYKVLTGKWLGRAVTIRIHEITE